MKALKCKPSAQFAYNYSINVLSKCSNIISHQSSIFESRHIYHLSSKVDRQSSKVNTSIFEGRHIDLRRLTHRSSIFEGRHIDYRSSKVDTSISEGRHIDLRKSTHGSSKVDTWIFEGRHMDLRRSTHRSLKIEGRNIALTTHHRTDNLSPNIIHNGTP